MKEARITLTARPIETPVGILVSLHTEGDFFSEEVNRRFYSIPKLPPDDIDGAAFWAPILADVARFLT